MVRFELLPETAERHARLLRRAVAHLEENRRLAAWNTAGAIGEIQQSLRELAELLEGGVESEPYDGGWVGDPGAEREAQYYLRGGKEREAQLRRRR